jgi:hypothetical protein
MGRIEIEDLPKDHEISKEEMKKVLGGALPVPTPRIFMVQPPDELSFFSGFHRVGWDPGEMGF